ncbi:MAG TPA: hypothetical protein VGF67_20325 [Ktedonobacteraceae bacterium]
MATSTALFFCNCLPGLKRSVIGASILPEGVIWITGPWWLSWQERRPGLSGGGNVAVPGLRARDVLLVAQIQSEQKSDLTLPPSGPGGSSRPLLLSCNAPLCQSFKAAPSSWQQHGYAAPDGVLACAKDRVQAPPRG